MSGTLRHISFRKLGPSQVQQRFLEDDRDLVQFLGSRARSVDELMRAAPTGAERLLRRDDLVDALLAYAEKHGAPDAVKQNAEALRDPKVHVVVTGQQPGLCGGPLYTLHKAATAIRLCREINAAGDGRRAVPLFWNHSDDHDFDEANRLFLVNKSQDVQRYRIDRDHRSESLRNIAVGRDVEKILAEIDSLLPDTEFREWALQTFAPRHPNETFGDLQARLMFAAFGEDGLIVIEPRDLPEVAFEPLPRWWSRAHEVRERVKHACEDLGDLGFDVTLDPTATMMFELTGGEREPLADGEAAGRAQDLSPGVLLRPLWQDAVLPTIAFVVGPGEFSYLAAVAPLYRLLGVPRPVFVPRSSLTLVEPSLQKLLHRFSLDITDLEQGPENLAESLQQDEPDDIGDRIADLRSRLGTDLDDIGKRLERLDSSMLGALARARGKMIDELERLDSKIKNAQQNKQGTGMRQIRKLCSQLRPRGRMQERVLGPLPYLVMHGRGLIEELIAAADPFRIEHGVLEL